MDLGIAVDLAGGGEDEARAHVGGQRQKVARAEHARQHRVDRVCLVMGRRGGARQIEDRVDPQRDRHAIDHVGIDDAEAGLSLQVPEVFDASGTEVVDNGDATAFGEQCVAQVRPNESGTARDECAPERFSVIDHYPLLQWRRQVLTFGNIRTGRFRTPPTYHLFRLLRIGRPRADRRAAEVLTPAIRSGTFAYRGHEIELELGRAMSRVCSARMRRARQRRLRDGAPRSSRAHREWQRVRRQQ